jgi:hypothetical protein
VRVDERGRQQAPAGVELAVVTGADTSTGRDLRDAAAVHEDIDRVGPRT